MTEQHLVSKAEAAHCLSRSCTPLCKTCMEGSEAWHKDISEESGLPYRCPLATLKKCPQYYESCSLVDQLQRDVDDDLQAFWKGSDDYPLAGDRKPELPGRNLAAFCPEVVFQTYGLYASSLGRFADDPDRDYRHTVLEREAIPATDWRWRYENIRALHFSQCPSYLLIGRDKSEEAPTEPIQEGPAVIDPIHAASEKGLDRSACAVWENLLKVTKPATYDEITGDLSMSRNTVSKALKALDKSGLIERIRSGGVLPAAKYRTARADTEKILK